MIDRLGFFASSIRRCVGGKKGVVTKIGALLCFLSLTGCRSGVLSPQGPIAHHELKLLIFATLLMLIVVVPVIFLTFWFAWRYRAGATRSKYTPDWCHSTSLELIWWAIPLVIIFILAVATWRTTHALNPYKPLQSDKKPVEIQVVALNWKWLFIYPKRNIATVNYFEIPTDRPVNFHITAAAPMNSFFIPQLGSQIYAMTGMTTQLHLLASHPGRYRGFSANYTGEGFAKMQFYVKATSEADYQRWIRQVKTSHSAQSLTWQSFWQGLAKPSVADPVIYYSSVDRHLFKDIVMSYMVPDYKPGTSHMYMPMKGMSKHMMKTS